MPLIDSFVAEFQQEAASTRKLLELCPEGAFGWKPHEKSMSLGQLAQHISEIPTWITMTLTTTELDFGKAPFERVEIKTTKELVAAFDKSSADALKQMQSTPDKDLPVNWTLRDGAKIFLTLPRVVVLRTFCFSHLIHHRGQLTVYLRMKNIPLPKVYGPTADSPDM